MSVTMRRVVRVAAVAVGLVLFGIARGFVFDIGSGLLGLFTGLTYGLLAVGLVIVYRSSGFINFAHGDIGFFSAATLITLVVTLKIPYWIALPLAMAIGACIGALTEVTVVRRLRRAPRLMSMIATLLLGQFLIGAGLAMNNRSFTGYLYPQPPGLPTFRVGGQLASQAHAGMLILTPIIVGALILFLRRSRFGLAIRAAASNPDAAAMAGILPGRMATMAWGLAGAFAAFTAAMWLPTRGFALGQFGPSLLVRALAAAVIGRLDSMPRAFAAGVGLGVVEQIVLFNTRGGGEIEAWIFAIILIALLLAKRTGSREEARGDWGAIQPWPPLPRAIAALRSVRVTTWGAAAGALALALIGGLWMSNLQAAVFAVTASFVLVGVSIGIVSGSAGQLSLGQFAIAGVGAVVAYHVAVATDGFIPALIAGTLAGMIVSILIGIPALRVRGLLLAVTTLSFAVASQSWLFSREWMLGGGVSVPRPNLFGLRVTTARGYWILTVILVALGLLIARNIRRSAFGRTLVALRDNEDAARAFTVHATTRKLQAFAVAGAFAGLGGVVFAFSQGNLDSGSFESSSSIIAVAATMIGGIAVLVGPIVGALYLVTMSRLLTLDTAGQAAHVLGAFLVVLLAPNGLVGSVRGIRDRLIARAARGLPVEGTSRTEGARPRISLGERVASRGDGAPLLQLREVRKGYGGVTAVDGVSLDVFEGETVGLIGPNGAGKTTLFELISGFTPVDAGTVTFAGDDVTAMGPEGRGARGMIRSFQEAALFPTMTLLEAVTVAQERTAPASLLRAVIGRDPAERRREERARDLIALMGLDGFRDKQIRELSTGSRRLGELTCLLALEPRLLLLDEPASGVAQRETEQLGPLLEGIKQHLGTTLIVIEHDLPLLRSISDRFVAMESGRVIAQGDPAAVQADARVADSFLGGSMDAIARSGPLEMPGAHANGHAPDDGRCAAVTRSGSRCARAAVEGRYCRQHTGVGASR